MGFRFYASGSSGFQFPARVIDFGSIYDLASGVDSLRTPPNSLRALGQNAVTSTLAPPSPMEAVLNRLGQQQGFSLLNLSLSLALQECSPMSIGVSARKTNTLMPDDVGFVQVFLRADDDAPAFDFVRLATPILERTELKTFGVLNAMSRMFSEYAASRPGRPGGDGTHRLLIQVSR